MPDVEVITFYTDEPSHPHLEAMRDLVRLVFDDNKYELIDPDDPRGAYYAGAFTHQDGQEPQCVSMGSMSKYVGDKMIITNMATRGDSLRQGLASRVLRALEGEARAASASAITLEAWLEAVPFYEANGYESDMIDPFSDVVGMDKDLT